MDNFELYTYTYEKTYRIAERFLRFAFIDNKNKNRPFATIKNQITKWLYVYTQENYTNILDTKYTEPFELFSKKAQYYEMETELEEIKCILENEIQEYFATTNNNIKDFIFSVAIHKALQEIYNIFSTTSPFFKLVYNQKKYKYIQFKKLKNTSYQTLTIYEKMMDIEYPYRIIEREIQNPKAEITTTKIDKIKNNLTHKKKQLFDFTEDDGIAYLITNYFNKTRKS
ncbi:hypothetical protein [Cellulophaga fucicola]|uniref:Uncharacterized protein n=1 Tax=Cellulophaga fucicola TaxID=76595 RepID=A0A1K1QXF6_9FLAO|nr:hypothetical protein [Cellulophaga fucicola]SFW64361.1 hypothetical protein SAMN05660313_03053 [Cellulophaga fucicola]